MTLQDSESCEVQHIEKKYSCVGESEKESEKINEIETVCSGKPSGVFFELSFLVAISTQSSTNIECIKLKKDLCHASKTFAKLQN